MSGFSPRQGATNYNAGGLQDRLLAGILLMAAGEAFMVGAGAAIKFVTTELPIVQVMFFRNFFALILILPLAFGRGFSTPKSGNCTIHLQRAIFGLAGMFLMFYSFSTLRLTEAVLLKATAPVWLSLTAWLVLRENLSILSCGAIGLAFLGVLVMIRPDQLELTLGLGVVAGLGGALMVSTAKIMIRQLGRTEPTRNIVFYFALFGTLFTLPAAIWLWQPVAAASWIFLLLIALLATFGQFCITKAYTVARAGKIGMFSYLSMPIAGLFGWMFWDETIDAPLLAGTAVIISAGALSFYASHRQGQNPVVVEH